VARLFSCLENTGHDCDFSLAQKQKQTDILLRYLLLLPLKRKKDLVFHSWLINEKREKEKSHFVPENLRKKMCL
jgi:hypothetical protein